MANTVQAKNQFVYGDSDAHSPANTPRGTLKRASCPFSYLVTGPRIEQNRNKAGWMLPLLPLVWKAHVLLTEISQSNFTSRGAMRRAHEPACARMWQHYHAHHRVHMSSAYTHPSCCSPSPQQTWPISVALKENSSFNISICLAGHAGLNLVLLLLLLLP